MKRNVSSGELGLEVEDWYPHSWEQFQFFVTVIDKFGQGD